MEEFHTGCTELDNLYGVGEMMWSIQEKHPTVMVKPCQSRGTPQGVALVLTCLAPEMGKETPCHLKVMFKGQDQQQHVLILEVVLPRELGWG